MLKIIKSHWKRAVSGLLAVVMAAGMLPVSAFAAGSGGNPYAPTGSFELNVAGATGWNSDSQPLAVYRTERGTAQATTVPAATAFALLEDNGGDRLKIGAGKYIKPGEYAVSEIIPPPNYLSTTEAQQIKLELDADGSGEIDLSNLPTGSYEVTEVECAGYVIDNAQRIIHLEANDTAQFVFTNTKKPGLKLVKTSADGTPLDGVTFRISSIGDEGKFHHWGGNRTR